MNKATPIPDTIQRLTSGTIETASCRHDGRRISRSIDKYELPWLHIDTGRTRCGEKP